MISWSEGLLLETEVAILIHAQEDSGVAFNIGKAVWLVTDLENRKNALYKEIRPYLDYILNIHEKPDKNTGEFSYVKKVRNANGSLTISTKNFIEDSGISEDDILGSFSRVELEEPSLSKRGCIISALLKLGWKPTIFTDKGTPKITDEGLPVDSLEKVGHFGKSLALWYVYNHRQSQIQGLIKNVRSDGRITAGMNTLGTNTFRATHRIVVNIPRVTSTYGEEMRSLFVAEPGRVMVGVDASGLELRMLAHYMADKEYIDLILNGDVHTYNMEAANKDAIKHKTKQIKDRNMAKTFCYGVL
jgi:hypothetical protein